MTTLDSEKSSNSRILTAISNWFGDLNPASGIVLAVVVGVIGGFGAIAFRWLIKAFEELFFGGGAKLLGFMGDYYVIILPAIGGLLVGLIIYFGAREAKGHGVPEVMAAVAERGGRIRPRVSIVKAIASSICIGSGGSVGREGPIVQIGSSFGSALGQWLRLPDARIRTLVACGAAAGVSATFNAPIGAVIFAMEVISRHLVTPRFGYVVISSVSANVISRIFLGTQPSFNVIQYSIVSYFELIPYAILGVLAAFIGFVFIKVLYGAEDLFEKWHFPEYLKPMIGGIGIGLIGLYSWDLFGVGYGEAFWTRTMGADQALLGQIPFYSLLIMCALKIIATSLTIGSGGSGGVFAPSLFIGAMLGGAFGVAVNILFPDITAPAGAYALVGMAAMFAGTARAPITAIIILFEMTADYTIILPLMVSVVISVVVSRALSYDGIYTMKLTRRGVYIDKLSQSSPLKQLTVGQVMTRNSPTVARTMSVSDLMTKLQRSSHHGFPVVDEENNLYGIVTLTDIDNFASKMNMGDLQVGDICTTKVVVAFPDQTVHDALARCGENEWGRIPVVDRTNPRKMLGVLRRHNITKAYLTAINREGQ